MKLQLTITLFFIITYSIFAQEVKLNDEIPSDQSFRKGVLSNGLTYYIHHTDKVKKTASYYIIHNVGSILEEDNQRGLAHFLEHMAFNGTENFPGKTLLGKLEENGLKFGSDINAYTGFDETVYNINNLRATPELIDFGLQILYDWSGGLTLSHAEIDAERGVVKEEWRTRANGSWRNYENTFGTTYGNSKYKDRLPIGLMSVIDNFEYQTLRDFYETWYRPDLQAIVVVGDIDPDDLEQRIKKKFSGIAEAKSPKERTYVKIPDNESLLYKYASDQEVTSSQIEFSIHYDRYQGNPNTIAFAKEEFVKNAVVGILGHRFNDLSKELDAPFKSVNTYYTKLTNHNDNFVLSISPKRDRQVLAFEMAMNELNRAVKMGVTKNQVDRVVAELLSIYENMRIEWKERTHGSIVLESVKDDFLNGYYPKDIDEWYKTISEIAKTITPREINERLREFYKPKNRKLVVVGVEGEDNLDKTTGEKIILNAESKTDYLPFKEEQVSRPLLHGIDLTPGKIIHQKHNQELGFTTFILSNGIRVYYQIDDKAKNFVQIWAKSKGGYSLLDKVDIPAAKMAYSTAFYSGLGSFDPKSLERVLSGKKVFSSFGIDETQEAISISSSTKDVETIFQLAHLRFVAPRFTDSGLKLAVQERIEFLENRKKDIGAMMMDSIEVNLFGKNNPYVAFNKESLSNVSLERIKAIYENRFENPMDFNFYMSGDLPSDSLVQPIEKYIASLPTNSRLENWKNINLNWTKDEINKDIFLEMENPKSTVSLKFKKALPYSTKDAIIIRCLAGILDLRLTETLREKEGGTYGTNVFGSLREIPEGEATIDIGFDCNPNLVENLVKIVDKELDDMKNNHIAREDFEKTIENLLKAREDQKNYSSFKFDVMVRYIEKGYNANLPKNYENILKNLHIEDIARMATRILEEGKSSKIVFKPVINP